MVKLKKFKEYDLLTLNGDYKNSDWFTYVNGTGETSLIINYFFRYYGEKTVYSGSESFEDILTDLRENIYLHFTINNNKYSKLLDALQAEYNPLYNVDATETRTYTKDNTGTVGNSGSESTTYGHTVANTEINNVTNSSTNTINNYKTSFNSSETELTSMLTENNPTSSNVNNSLNSTEGGTDARTITGLQTNNLNEVYEESLRRYGNIGVTKSTELIQSEIELRIQFELFNIICSDLSKAVLLNVYD